MYISYKNLQFSIGNISFQVGHFKTLNSLNPSGSLHFCEGLLWHWQSREGTAFRGPVAEFIIVKNGWNFR